MKMSKNLKKFLALALALAMVFALAACGEPAPTESDTPDESAAPSESTDTGEYALSYEVIIPADGVGDHPAYGILTNAKEALASIGIDLQINDPSDSNVLWQAIESNPISAEFWCAAWQATADPDMYQVYHSSNAVGAGGTNSNAYMLCDPTLDELIMEARTSSDQAFRKATYKQCLDIIIDWAVEVPVYQRQNAIIMSTERVNIDTVTPDITTFWDWMNDIELLETNGNDQLLGVGAVNASDMDPKAGVWFSLGEDGSAAEVDDGLAALPFGKYTLEELRSDSNEGYDLVKKAFVIERDSSAAKAVWMSLDDKEGPKIQTEAADASDGDHVAQASSEVTLSDTVYYENLKTDGTEYTVTGTLMLKSTGEALADADGNAVTASKTFKPKRSSGEVELKFAFDGSLLAGEDVVAFESLASGGVEVAAHTDLDDEGQTVRLVGIGTTATDKADGDKLVTGADITIVDEVAYEGLVPGVEYTLEAALMDAETGDPVTVGGKLVTGTATFAPDEADGVQTVELAFDGAGFGGKGVVVFEKLFTVGVQIAAHEDLSDEGQTVTVVEIGTKLTDAEDGDQVVASGKVKLVDTVEYKGLVPGETYTANGTLVDKSTGEALVDAGGNPVTATAEFAPKATEGTVEVAFEFDAPHLEGGGRPSWPSSSASTPRATSSPSTRTSTTTARRWWSTTPTPPKFPMPQARSWTRPAWTSCLTCWAPVWPSRRPWRSPHTGCRGAIPTSPSPMASSSERKRRSTRPKADARKKAGRRPRAAFLADTEETMDGTTRELGVEDVAGALEKVGNGDGRSDGGRR